MEDDTPQTSDDSLSKGKKGLERDPSLDLEVQARIDSVMLAHKRLDGKPKGNALRATGGPSSEPPPQDKERIPERRNSLTGVIGRVREGIVGKLGIHKREPSPKTELKLPATSPIGSPTESGHVRFAPGVPADE